MKSPIDVFKNKTFQLSRPENLGSSVMFRQYDAPRYIFSICFTSCGSKPIPSFFSLFRFLFFVKQIFCLRNYLRLNWRRVRGRSSHQWFKRNAGVDSIVCFHVQARKGFLTDHVPSMCSKTAGMACN